MPEGVCQSWLQAVTCRRDMVSKLPRTPNLRGNDIELSWKPVYPCAAVAHGVDDRPGDLLLLLLLPLPTGGDTGSASKVFATHWCVVVVDLAFSLPLQVADPSHGTDGGHGRTDAVLGVADFR